MQESPETVIKIPPRFVEQIKRLLEEEENRFAGLEDFVQRAIEVLLTWEKTPEKSMEKFSEMNLTIKQFSQLLDIFNKEIFQTYYPGFPEAFGEEWGKYCDENEGVREKYEEVFSEQDENKISNQEKLRRDKNDLKNTEKEFIAAKHFVDKQNFKSIEIENGQEICYDGWPLLFTHYSRIFPAKLALIALGEVIRREDTKMVNFEKFTEIAYDIVEEASTNIKRFEESKKIRISRENRLSTGLPRLPDEKTDQNTQKKFEQRYKDRLFGKVRKTKHSRTLVLDGLMSALGLIRVFKVGNEVVVTISENGKEFYKMDNPWFEHRGDVLFSDKEREFISKTLLKNRKLETKLVKESLKCINESDYLSDIINSLDNLFLETISVYAKERENDEFQTKIQEIVENTHKIKKEKIDFERQIKETSDKNEKDRLEELTKRQTPVQAIRIATLGRMSELGLVDWEITEGKSKYTLGKDEFIKDILND